MSEVRDPTCPSCGGPTGYRPWHYRGLSVYETTKCPYCKTKLVSNGDLKGFWWEDEGKEPRIRNDT